MQVWDEGERMILSIYLLASIVFFGLSMAYLSALVATGLLDFLIVGFLLDRVGAVRKVGRDLVSGIQRMFLRLAREE